MATHNWHRGDKVVWVDERGAQFLGKVIKEDWREITVDFSDYPACGLLDGLSETKVLEPDEVHAPKGNETEAFLPAYGLAHRLLSRIAETCTKQGVPLGDSQRMFILNTITHTLFNEAMKQEE